MPRAINPVEFGMLRHC